MVLTGAGECLGWNNPQLGSFLLGCAFLRDVEAYWPNEVEKGSRGGRVGVMRGLVQIRRWWKGLRILDALLLFFSFKLPMSYFSFFLLHFTFLSALNVIPVLILYTTNKLRFGVLLS